MLSNAFTCVHLRSLAVLTTILCHLVSGQASEREHSVTVILRYHITRLVVNIVNHPQVTLRRPTQHCPPHAFILLTCACSEHMSGVMVVEASTRLLSVTTPLTCCKLMSVSLPARWAQRSYVPSNFHNQHPSGAMLLAAAAVLLALLAHPVLSVLEFPDCEKGLLARFPICDPSLDYQSRAVDLVSRLSLEEKIQRLGNTATAIDRIGLPLYQFGTESLHGWAYTGGVSLQPAGQPYSNTTQFPQNILSSAAFDRQLWWSIASTISTEARALSNVGLGGLDMWTPQLNLVRDPRWGRGQETPGEDPYHSSQFAFSMVRGLQEGEDSRYYKTVSTAKVSQSL